ncbi:LysE family translocator [Nesterenkonia sphaerica]|uniref:LysE family translocator n=1 Tax=Nesterenkonia sphaerica TaxID=1804988 RepID=A0A5R9A9C0_9MICC|nr:LysE family translocator [Nesterenkonia sphaerica]
MCPPPLATQDRAVTLSTYLAFLGVAVILAVTPGPDTLLSLRYALVSRRAGAAAATGSSVAMFVWAALAALGLAALFEASDIAYYVVSLLGGCYLLLLGARTCWTARGRFRDAAVISAARLQQATPAQQQSTTPLTPLFAGMATCMTNPKVGLFFLALFPQFTPTSMGPVFAIVVLGGTVVLTVFAYLISVVLLVDAANRWLSNPRVTGWIELVSGLTLLCLGLYMVIAGTLGLLP